jgi:ABC-type phosphate/phosphonate transport system substrate-binding protein
VRGTPVLTLVAALAGLVGLGACVAAAPRVPSAPLADRPAQPARERVRFIHTSQGATQAPIWLALEGGHFLANGLAVDLAFVSGSATATQALLAGEAEIVAQGGSAAAAAALDRLVALAEQA